MPILDFESYVGVMRPWVRRITFKRARPHPFLSQDDLLQEAVLALWQVWQRYHRRKPQEELCRIGTKAIVDKMVDRVRLVPFIERKWTRAPATVLGSLPDQGGVDDMLLADAVDRLEVQLSPDARLVLREVFRPSVGTLGGIHTWSGRDGMRWPIVRERALMAAFGWPARRVRAAWGETARAVNELLNSGSIRYTRRGTEPGPTPQREEPGHMETLPNVDELPEAGEKATKPTPKARPKKAAATTAKKKERAVKPKKKEGPKMVKTKKGKGKKVASKVKASAKRAAKASNGRVKLPEPTSLIPKGVRVTYIGGAKANDWLKPGDKGTVGAVSYRVKFDKHDRETLIPGRVLKRA